MFSLENENSPIFLIYKFELVGEEIDSKVGLSARISEDTNLYCLNFGNVVSITGRKYDLDHRYSACKRIIGLDHKVIYTPTNEHVSRHGYSNCSMNLNLY